MRYINSLPLPLGAFFRVAFYFLDVNVLKYFSNVIKFAFGSSVSEFLFLICV